MHRYQGMLQKCSGNSFFTFASLQTWHIRSCDQFTLAAPKIYMFCSSILLEVESNGVRIYENYNLCASHHLMETPTNRKTYCHIQVWTPTCWRNAELKVVTVVHRCTQINHLHRKLCYFFICVFLLWADKVNLISLGSLRWRMTCKLTAVCSRSLSCHFTLSTKISHYICVPSVELGCQVVCRPAGGKNTLAGSVSAHINLLKGASRVCHCLQLKVQTMKKRKKTNK